MKKKKSLFKTIIQSGLVVTGAAFAGLSLLAYLKKPDSVYDNQPEEKNKYEGKKVIFVEDENDEVNADGVRGHLESTGDSIVKTSIYEKYIKRGLDIILSFGGMIVLSPLLAGIALAIKIDDPGPVLFTQKRVGKNKQYFKLHKFRSMKMSTPHNVPTHMLEDPDQYITRVGKFIRAHSIDELPQIWDIFIGNMSVIGPRPALWNQDVLTAEREKYGVNEVKPGLTGLAQINGRDELELSEKAKLDGDYVKNIDLVNDYKCFMGSVGVFAGDNSLVEGGTGEMARALRPGVPEEDPLPVFGCDKEINITEGVERKVLVVGEGSYIGESFQKYAKGHYPNIQIDMADTLHDGWKDMDFSSYDSIYHIAGIAHADIGHVDDETKEKYYKVNTDLAINVAKKAKREGVKQFILMSSMIVYGDSGPYGKQVVITKKTEPYPSNFYGDSKWQADKGVRALEDNFFKVAVLRSPMIYGKGSKGNYPTLKKLAKTLPIFPKVSNQRSMLHIDNLCEFLCKLIMSGENGIYFPQNSEYTRTYEMVKEIGNVSGNNVMITDALNPAIAIASFIPGRISQLVNKAFGNYCYNQEISEYSFDYRVLTFKDSIKKTEGQ